MNNVVVDKELREGQPFNFIDKDVGFLGLQKNSKIAYF